ncbi:PREDICTED: monocarboxylate transporter 3 [Bison bison bison]|uniref:Monocarboxylate transporter 3 n=1 Tax=Bison bison bison TaxID=43346 RepID=A0A6P3HM27_BISBB|nr:PREDICTED: monocarboxylate transporter 3 [Bison bison bison]
MGASGPRRGPGPPDGGWGWAVLGACFVITGFAYGFPKAVSVFFRALMRDFGAGYSDTAWVSSIMLAMLYGTGPVSSILVTRFGCRPVMLVGGLLASAGMILASFATRLLELYLTAGVLTGLGLALNFQPSLIMLGLYFERRRPLANGLAAAGSPVFLSALSPLGQQLLEHFGWRGGFLLLGGLLLNCCASNGLTDLSSARARSYGALVAFCIAFGLSYGMVGALQFEVLMAAVGAPRFPSALGLVLLLEAVAVLIGPPSAGRLVDALKNYEIIFYLAGSEVALAGIFMAVATNCCLRRPRDGPPSPGTEGGAGDREEAEAEVDSDLPPAGTEEPGGLEAVEVPSPGTGPSQPEVKMEPGLDS